VTDIEKRTGGLLECRAGTMDIGGRALTFNSRSRPIGGPNGFIEVVTPGLIQSAKDSGYRDLICRYNHQDEYLLGAVPPGTLRVSDDERGVDYVVTVPPWLDWVYRSTERGDLRSSSFTFANAVSQWSYGDDGMPLRTVVGGELLEVSPCPIGQYEDADVALRSLAVAKEAPYAEVKARFEAGRGREFFTRSDGGPDRNNPIQPAPAPAFAFTGRNGAEALAEARSMAPVMGRSRLLEAQAQRWPAYMTQAWDAMPPTPVTALEAAQREHAEAKRELARLNDSAGQVLQELAQAEVERAERRAADYLASKSGQPISGAAALRLTNEMMRP
jgi:HK97 family phage prohead protease